MSWWIWVVAAVALVAATTAHLSWTAGRLDRLHVRVEAARATLDAQLYRRSAVALEVATSGLLDPAASLVLADAAHRARAAEPADRELAESDLTRALDAAFCDPEVVAEVAGREGASELLAELSAASRRVEMARRFHNDTVVSARALRGRRRVRWFRLSGHAALPETVEMADGTPRGLLT